VCVLLGFNESLCAGIDDFNVCVLLGFDERLCVGIDDFKVCVLLKFDERLCVGIDYCMCVFYWTFVIDYVLGLIIACVCVFMLKSCDFARIELCSAANLKFAAEMDLFAAN